jgi:hypothetical protein
VYDLDAHVRDVELVLSAIEVEQLHAALSRLRGGHPTALACTAR